MTTPVLTNSLIQVTPERENYNTIRRKYQDIAEKKAGDFAEQFSTRFKSMDDLYDQCQKVARAYLSTTVDIAISDLIAQGIHDIDDDHFIDRYLSKYLTWGDDFDKIGNQYEEIGLNAEELDNYRTARRENRGKWIGGGFGLSGAIKGAAGAAAANLAIGAAHAIFNGMGKAVSTVNDNIKKKKLFDDPYTKNHLTKSIYKLVFQVNFALVDAINSKTSGSLLYYVSQEDEEKAKRLLENITKGRIKGEVADSNLLEALKLNPYDPALYTYWQEKHGDANGELEKSARHFGISVVTENKSALLDKKVASLNGASPEAYLNAIPNIKNYAKDIGFIGIDKVLNTIHLDALKAKRQSLNLSNSEKCISEIKSLNQYAELLGIKNSKASNILDSAYREAIELKHKSLEFSNPASCVIAIKTLLEYAESLGVNASQKHGVPEIISNIRRAAVKDKLETLDLSTPESCIAAIESLHVHAKLIGLDSINEVEEELKTLAKKIDIDQRTVEGREFASLADANNAREKIRLKNNTIGSSIADAAKIIFSLFLFLGSLGLILDNKDISKLWLPYILIALAIFSIKEVRSLRAMKWASKIGGWLVAVGITILVPSTFFYNGNSNTILGAGLVLVAGSTITALIGVRHKEVGYGKLASHLLINGLVGGVLGTIFVLLSHYGVIGTSPQPPSKLAIPPTQATQIPPQASTKLSNSNGQEPTTSAALTALYKITPTSGGTITLPDGQIASLYYSTTIMTDMGQRHIIFIQRSKPGQESYTDNVKIDVVSFRNDSGHWIVDTQAQNLLTTGSYGSAAPIDAEQAAKIEHHSLKDGVAGMFLPNRSSHQGYSNDFFDIVSISPGKIEYLGKIEVSGDNAGACDPAEKTGMQSCFNWNGKIEVTPGKSDQYGTILVKKTGNEHVGASIALARSTTYSKVQGAGYEPPHD